MCLLIKTVRIFIRCCEEDSIRWIWFRRKTTTTTIIDRQKHLFHSSLVHEVTVIFVGEILHVIRWRPWSFHFFYRTTVPWASQGFVFHLSWKNAAMEEHKKLFLVHLRFMMQMENHQLFQSEALIFGFKTSHSTYTWMNDLAVCPYTFHASWYENSWAASRSQHTSTSYALIEMGRNWKALIKFPLLQLSVHFEH